MILSPEDSTDPKKLRLEIAMLDRLLYPVIEKIVSAGKTPILIGGGHNNCFPMILGSSNGIRKPIDCINIDPHSDLRALEGRHSGNGFSYAIEGGLLQRYHMIGLHEQYNSAYIWEKMSKYSNISFSTYEEYLDHFDLSKIIGQATSFVGKDFGLELDLDAICMMPSSAFTPSGFSLAEIRHVVRKLAQHQPLYFHLAEGAPRNASEELVVGKALAYLVCDFIKNCR